jgi:flagellar hook-basal body complex protein FliE
MSSPISGLGAIGTISSLPKLSPLEPALQQVNQLSTGADQQISSLLSGANTDMSSVMIAVEKADVSFQLMMQLRNKIVSAYQDIEKMQF